MSDRKTSKTRGAFTLIELLVVISIIALLVSILMPALAKARALAKVTVCQNRIKQMAFGMIYYSEDNNDVTLTVGAAGGCYYWYDELAEPMGVKGYKDDPVAHSKGIMEIINCPNVKKPPFTHTARGSVDRPWHTTFAAGLGQASNSVGSYTINSWCQRAGVYGQTSEDFYFSKKFSAIPGEAPIFMDGAWVDTWPRSTDIPPTSIDDPSGSPNNTGNNVMRRICIDRHDKQINIGFIDSHVERIQLDKLWEQKWHKGYRRRSSRDILESYPNFAALLR